MPFIILIGLWFFGTLLGGATPFGLFDSKPAAGVGGAAAGIGILALFTRAFRGDRWCWLGISFLVWYSVYGIKVGAGSEFWPYRGWGYDSLSFFGRPWAFWYTVIYTLLMTVFGISALKRWGLDRKDRFQILRFTSLLAFQWIFFS